MPEKTTEPGRKPAKKPKPEVVEQVPLSELHPFPDHPFQVRDDDAMQETVESVKTYGVLVPALARPREDGGYELIAGHRRKHACELAGLTTMPVIVRNIDRDAATIIMVDSNLQRENILPSERAKAYKMKLEAIRRKAGRPAKESETLSEENGGQVGHNLRGVKTRDLLAENSDDSARTIQRYIRLTELSPELQQMVDEKKIAMTPAVEISYLKPEEQKMLLTAMDSEQATPSLSQAQRMKKLSREGALNDDSMLDIMMEQKKPEKSDITLSGEKLRKYFPRSYTPFQIENTIFKLTSQPQAPLGKYGRMRKNYLKEHRPVLWNSLLLSETLYPHLREIDETANRRLEQMMPELMQSAGVTEELKASDPMTWVGLMNSLKAQAEETILAELIYA